MTEKEKMLAGEIYSAVDPQLIEELTEVKEIIHDYNLLRPSEKQKAREILKGLLGHIADDTTVSRLVWASGSLPTSILLCSTKPQSPLVTTALSARMSAYTQPVIVLTP